MQPPEPEHVGVLLRIWIEIKNTPTEIIVGFITFLTVILKVMGRTTTKDIKLTSNATVTQMNACKDEMLQHVDDKLDDVHSRIDDLYKLIASKNT